MWDGKLFKGTKLLSARIGFELQPCHLGADWLWTSFMSSLALIYSPVKHR
jgi:hypothetical protein